MNSHGHDERLSAFYDGELPAVERAEVERLLAESPELRAELAGMTDLSQRLSDLADDGAHFDLRAGVMEAIRKSGVGRRESGAGRESDVRSSAGPAVDQPLTINHQPSSARRRWMPLVLMTCSLALLVAAILPLMMKSDMPLIASNDTATDSPFAAEGTLAPMAAPAMAKSAVVESLDATNGIADNGPAVAMQAAPDAAMGDLGGVNTESDPSELLQSIAQKRRLNPGELIKQLVEVGGEAMLAEYQVVDVQRSFSQVEVLLKDNGIIPLGPDDERAESDGRDAKSGLEKMRVIVIDAEPTPLNEALDQFVASPENSEVMVTNLDSVALLQEAQEPESPKGGLAMRSAAPLPAPAAIVGAPAPKDDPAVKEETLVSRIAPKSMPFKKAEDPAAAAPFPAPGDAAKFDAHTKGKAISDAPQQMVMGNSVTISNGDEIYPALEVAAKNAYGRQNVYNQGQGLNRRAGSRAGVQDLVQQPASPVDVFAQNAQNGARAPDLQYAQRSMNRMRQLAILVLRPKPMQEPEKKTP
jgi:anti-sigma factor RsiW